MTCKEKLKLPSKRSKVKHRSGGHPQNRTSLLVATPVRERNVAHSNIFSFRVPRLKWGMTVRQKK